ncbi:hypothetical protein BUALT_Bualt05G0160800 [Buddleja alternifolia]|uniref:Cysteine-rich receptor-like protein kinase 2 n=1 Tax=Buddleja alternifolia TaxID=168488 RepID=A0AAV6XNZ7_9LAMI|nr:hypothetical protein BUALT_Bualt05G0160800 [Buddleja alternifolia]
MTPRFNRKIEKTKQTIMKMAILVPSVTITILVILLLPDALFADPRAQIVNLGCGAQPIPNISVFSSNYVANMDSLIDQVRTSGFGTSITGLDPDAHYALAQCYGDLSVVDCILCFLQARNVISRCFPRTGGIIYLDGCFVRGEIYSFFQEYTGPNDHAVCGNITRNGSSFRESTMRALSQAVLVVLNNNGYARAQMAVSRPENGAVYILAECWRTLNTSSCRACLEDASKSVSRCLPASEGRALNTGCFIRYSDTNFLNPIPGNGNQRGRVIVIGIATAAGVSILIIGAIIGIYMRKQRIIEKKRKGDASKLMKTLHDSSLNFKYSTLEKATGSFDEANKLGQGGFGTVYKAWKHFQQRAVEELFDPNLMLHNYHNNIVKNDILRVVHVGLLCTQEIPSLRPSMSKALEMLVKKEELPAPTSPPFMDENTMELIDMSENPLRPLDSGNAASIANISEKKLMKTSILVPYITIIMVILLFPDALFADPRTQTVYSHCGTQLEHNITIFAPNFNNNMVKVMEQMRASGSATAVTGSGLDAHYGLAQCYGDLSLNDCILCFSEALNVGSKCYPWTGGMVYLDGCFMRGDNYYFFQEYTGPNDHAVCGNITRNDSTFRESTRRALLQAVSFAPNNNGYARARVPVTGTGNDAMYVLASCWRTINASSCRACLENASKSILGCLPASEARTLNTGCFMRYSDTNFLNPIPGNGIPRGRVIVIGIAATSATAVLVIGVVIGIYIRKQRIIEKKRNGDTSKLVKSLHDSSLNFKYSTLEKATASFDEANKIGRGGFGTVYKGVLADGREIAVKRLFFNNKNRAADFYNEVNIISSVEHNNLVRLLGCSCSGPESLLVYEFLPNKSLDCFIFDSDKGKALSWEKRFEIIIGTTRGLAYLHENTKARIIHRDIKASNILLDSRLRAKIADFGLARSFQEDKSHISTVIAGTLGYMAPEYIAYGHLTEKADVYSFGVVLLEIVSGIQNNGSNTSEYPDNLLTTIAWKHFKQSSVEELFDPNLMLHNYHNINVKNEISRVVHIGLLCTQENATLRPSMSKVLEMLVKKEQLPAPSSPPFMDESTMELNNTSEHLLSSLEDGNSGSVSNISHSIFYPR